MTRLNSVGTSTLDIAYEEHGRATGSPIVLLHGFPYDVRCFDAVVPLLVEAGFRVLVPYLRGFGPTTFKDFAKSRSGEQAALAQDLLDFADALHLRRPLLAGFDWGGRAAVAAAALWPERFGGLLSTGGYSIYDVRSAWEPSSAEKEWSLWYQYYFLTDRGRKGLARNRRAICHLLWRLWSPNWKFDEVTFERSAISFDNSAFVDVVIHSYRHRHGAAAGDPTYSLLESRLADRPPVTIPVGMLGSGAGPFVPGAPAARDFSRLLWFETVADGGHNLPQERPAEFARGIVRLGEAVGAPRVIA